MSFKFFYKNLCIEERTPTPKDTCNIEETTIDNNQWWKDNIWGEASSYGKVYLNKDQRIDFNERQTNIFGRRISNI